MVPTSSNINHPSDGRACLPVVQGSPEQQALNARANALVPGGQVLHTLPPPSRQMHPPNAQATRQMPQAHTNPPIQTGMIHFPSELSRIIMEASPCPFYTYIQLLGLSHAFRMTVRGTLREITIPESDPALYDSMPAITADALAALVGPCKSLYKLTFPTIKSWRDFCLADSADWVDEAFRDHTQLAVLVLPSLSESDTECILSHLPGLVELTVSPHLAMSTNLLAALARSCPSLQVLRCSVTEIVQDQLFPLLQPDLSALAPLSGILKELDISDADPLWPPSGATKNIDLRALDIEIGDENLEPFVGTLTAVTSLRLFRCPPAALKPIASHLTSLKLARALSEEDLPGPWLCHLEALSLDITRTTDPALAPLARLLAANRATMRRLSLRLSDAEEPSLKASLRAMPRLTQLVVSRSK
ncbi:hypothetical protein PAPYR_8423 [Paratrimastix pyriformis]|uniref:F-box domain-containing protein n=1 Tax=Paratrimastix pyriformis TaxID=342808 RepID=A0ABQ8UDD8_9EUKA|nr:hypothetical protein PAPYR_8423 [Paratrimastix pyriformis]